jgi:L-cysteine desulfidase
MTDVRDLDTLKQILKKVAESNNCVVITGYDGRTVLHISKTLDKVIKRYTHESERVKRCLRKKRWQYE